MKLETLNQKLFEKELSTKSMSYLFGGTATVTGCTWTGDQSTHDCTDTDTDDGPCTISNA